MITDEPTMFPTLKPTKAPSKAPTASPTAAPVHLTAPEVGNGYKQAKEATDCVTVPTNLGGLTLTSGVYCSASGTFSITTTQTLTLDAEHNPDA
jgi:hypothetical protein